MSTPMAICLYCGASEGRDQGHRAQARKLGERLGAAGATLVYGGGAVGLMGVAAAATRAAGGRVVGVIPRFLLEREVGWRGADELIVTDGMHERKQAMFERADAFLALPGGVGTLDETLEMLTWRQLGRHEKPIVLVNHAGYWDPLIALFERIVDHDFARPSLRELYLVAPDVDDALARIGFPAP